MKGFFDKAQLQTPYRSEKGILSCVSCGLYKTAITPKMKPYGKFEKGIMVIGEAPSEEADEKGKPWQGKNGRIIHRKFKQLGIDLFEDCVSLYTVNCRPIDEKGNNRQPNDHEISCCRQKVIAAVKQYTPKLIILLGGAAISSIITGYCWRGSGKGGLNIWRGWNIPDRGFNAWICPTFHPSFIERQEEENEAHVIWTQDLEQSLSKLEGPFPSYKNEAECVKITYDVERVLTTILKNKPEFLAFDLETTGIKPYNKEEHKIVTISFCYDENFAYAIPFPTEPRLLCLLKRVLTHPKIGKIAANMKYEDNWMTFLHGIEVHPWVFDTMQAAHILDNRPGITGLKFQAYVQFGTPDYDSDIKPYLHSKYPNIPNKIMDMVKDPGLFKKLLLYNGMDSLITYRLAMRQIPATLAAHRARRKK
ncbi:MAG: DNA polymerase I [Spirochaetes bacterium ADurb.Bin001]|nr:MAG: DNA polymerase I [Spirochaetes bacterium ADurb.Bin001]